MGESHVPSHVTRPLVGRWHLVDPATPADQVPSLRIDFLFRLADGHLSGAFVTPAREVELALAEVQYDGVRLCLHFPRAPVPDVDRSPAHSRELMRLELRRRADDDIFEGSWTDATGTRLGSTVLLRRASRA